MARKRHKPGLRPTRLGLIVLGAVALFLAGEAFLLSRSDRGRLKLARQFGIGDRSQVVRVIGRSVREALATCGVASDSIHESLLTQGASPPVRWRIGIEPEASLLQANYAVTQALEERGAAVIEAREAWTPRGATLTMKVGLPKRATHELVLVRALRLDAESEPEPARLSLVLFGFRDEAAAADSFFALPASFAVALSPGTEHSGDLFRFAHRREREVVLHLPLEPINYPSVNPGPGTLLVTMKPARIARDVRRYLDQAAPVSAVANHMGSLATQDMTVMTAVYRELRKQQVPFLHVNPAAGAVCRPLASEMGVQYLEPGFVIDGETRVKDTRQLEKSWKEALAEARHRGQLMVLVRATPLTYRWLPKALEAKRLGDVRVVPLSAMLRRPGAT